MKIIQLFYQTILTEGSLLWEKYEFEIIKTVASSDNTSFTIFMKSPMPIEEMDNVVKELCDSLNYRFNTLSKYYRNEI